MHFRCFVLNLAEETVCLFRGVFVNLFKGLHWSLLGGALIVVSEAPQADPLVPEHNLDCSREFPCPKALQRRVDFWIEVYATWDTKKAILHDSKYPERVFEVVDAADSCGGSRSEPNLVKNARARVKKELLDLSVKVSQIKDKDKKKLEKRQQRLVDLYPVETEASLKAAAGRIRCQQGNRDRFEDALRRFGTYSGLVNKVLEESGLPQDVQYLPFVESLYNPDAYSRVGAAGLWQIMPRTARSLGLELNATLDERLDPEAASWAAARYLNQSTKSLKGLADAKFPGTDPLTLNPFVITSYNYGVTGMRRALSKIGPDFIEVLNKHKSPSFRVAVKNFYASFLAARYVARNAQEYFGEVESYQTLEYETVLVKQPTSIERIKEIFDVSEDVLRPLNRALTRFVWHEWRYLPEGYRLRLPLRKEGWEREIVELEKLDPEEQQMVNATYKVKRGDTACGIARAFRINCRKLIRANRLGKRAFLRVGQTLVLPGRRIVKKSPESSKKIADVVKDLDANGKYIVRKGDTACKISQQFDVGCRDLITKNKLGRRAVIYVGQRLIIPGLDKQDNQTVATVSETEIEEQTTSQSLLYKVKKGESPCGIANRVKISCREIMALNKLTRKSLIHPGQILKIPTPGKKQIVAAVEKPLPVSEIQTKPDESDNVTAEETTAEKDKTSGAVETEKTLDGEKENDATAQSAVEVVEESATGVTQESPQEIRIDTIVETYSELVAKEESDTSRSAPTSTPRTDVIAAVESPDDPTPSPLEAMLDSVIDLGVTTEKGDPVKYYVRVEPEETLGHFSDWLGIGGTQSIRKLNKLRLSQSIAIGEKLRLPIDGEKDLETFARKREEYHRVLVEEFKENYQITSVEEYKVIHGDSLWSLGEKFELPLWIVTRFNPHMNAHTPEIGQILSIPKIDPRDVNKEPPAKSGSTESAS